MKLCGPHDEVLCRFQRRISREILSKRCKLFRATSSLVIRQSEDLCPACRNS